jgi:decaprenylphospho-beta-D-erythro-pentofuranosid-2-ulose 2-reductase
MNDAFGRPSSVLVLGGTSDIARALVRQLAAGGVDKVLLAGRDQARLDEAVAEVKAAGAGAVASLVFDARDVAAAAGVIDSAFAEAGRVDLVLVAVGLLVDSEQEERDPERVAECIAVNFAWPATALARVADHFRTQGSGRAVVLSSVAGVRVRRANYVYGSAKAGLDEYSRNLHQALAGSGAGVTVVRPGFVHSKMTIGRPAAPMSTTPDAVARDIVRGLENGDAVVWSPGKLRMVFLGLQMLPEPLWRRLPG